MSDYLIQAGSNHVYVSTPELLKRSDMAPYDLAKLGYPPKKVIPAPEVDEIQVKAKEEPSIEAGTAIENIIHNKGAISGSAESKDTPGNATVRAKLETFEDPTEMVKYVNETYGLKLTRTMKKSTMIDRTLEFIEGEK